MRLKDKVAVITGGSRGIGYATAKAFLKEGAVVVIAASNDTSVQKAADQLRQEFPESKIGAISPNLASLEDVRKAFQYVRENFGFGSALLPLMPSVFATSLKD